MRVAATSYDGPMHSPSKIRSAPIAFALVALSSLIFLLFKELGFYGSILQLFNFVPVELTPRGGRLGEPGNDWWRFITPTLLHFSWMHLVFNCLWIWEFGRRIEASLGSMNLLGLYLASAVFSNSVQYFISGPSIFGGMSGVVYAFMGFIWTGNALRPHWIEPLPPAIMGFMLIWLLVGLVGALEILGAGAIANGAHLGGLVIGIILGGVFALLSRLDRS